MAGDRIITIAYILLGAGLLLFIWLLIRTVGRISGKYEKLTKFKARFGGFVDFMSILFGVLLILGSQLFFWLSTNLKYHIPLSGKAELGLIETFSQPEWDYQQGFRYMPMRSEGYGQTFSFELEGDSWHLAAEKISWPPWMKSLGLETSYKIDGFYGGEGEPVVQDLLSKTSYEIDGGQSAVYAFYNRYGGLLLGLKAELIKCSNRNFVAGRSYTVSADSSGLVLQEMW